MSKWIHENRSISVLVDNLFELFYCVMHRLISSPAIHPSWLFRARLYSPLECLWTWSNWEFQRSLRSRPSGLSDRQRSKNVCEWLSSPQGISPDSLMGHSCEDDKLAGGHLKEQEENPLRNLFWEQGFDVVNDQILMRKETSLSQKNPVRGH